MPSAIVYESGLALLCLGTIAGGRAGTWAGVASGAGTLLLGATVVAYVAVFMYLMGPNRRHARPAAPVFKRPGTGGAHRGRGRSIRLAYGPFVTIVASAYAWALVGGVLMLIDGAAGILGGAPPVNPDAVRHSMTIGYIALLICGVAPRMVPGFSRGHIASPWLVRATLWLGNSAAVLRVGSLLVAPALAGLGAGATGWIWWRLACRGRWGCCWRWRWR